MRLLKGVLLAFLTFLLTAYVARAALVMHFVVRKGLDGVIHLSTPWGVMSPSTWAAERSTLKRNENMNSIEIENIASVEMWRPHAQVASAFPPCGTAVRRFPSSARIRFGQTSVEYQSMASRQHLNSPGKAAYSHLVSAPPVALITPSS